MKNRILNRVIATIGVTAVLFGSLTGCGSASSSTDSAAGVTKVTVATKGSPAPYMVVDENNEIGGSDIEILKAIFENSRTDTVIFSDVHDKLYRGQTREGDSRNE